MFTNNNTGLQWKDDWELFLFLQMIDSDTSYKPNAIELEALSKIKKLDIFRIKDDFKYDSIPNSISLLKNLEELQLVDGDFTYLPQAITKLTKLKWLNISGSEITEVPAWISQFTDLELLGLSHTKISVLPESLSNLKKLYFLSLAGTNVHELPIWLGNLTTIRILELNGLHLRCLPQYLVDWNLPFWGRTNVRDGIYIQGLVLDEQPIKMFLNDDRAEICKWFKIEEQLSDIYMQDSEKYNSHDIPLIRKVNYEERYIFVSYSHKDKEIVFPIILKLSRAGYRIWFDEHIDAGTEWDNSIARHISNSSFMISFISNNYLQSSNCIDELTHARNKEIKQLLIYLDDATLPEGLEMRLNRYQHLNYNPSYNRNVFYEKLFSADGIQVCHS